MNTPTPDVQAITDRIIQILIQILIGILNSAEHIIHMFA